MTRPEPGRPHEDPAAAAELATLRRLAPLDALVPTLTGVLDLRDVFGRVSDLAKQALPHDLFGVATVAEDGASVTVYAVTGGAVPDDVPTTMTLREAAIPAEPWEYTIVDDLAAAGDAAVPRTVREGAARLGLRSMLRLPIRYGGRLAGVVNFTSKRPAAYSREDLLAAGRIRDHLALALSHQRLAEVRERLAEERERSARAEERIRALSSALEMASGYTRIVGVSAPWRAVLAEVDRVAPTDATVLVTGETGTGKEVVARAIHRGSRRATGPFVAINCAAIPEHLLESELFGYEQGAFSGAVKARAGRIDHAAGGTLFLDEIGDMSPALQAKMLRFLDHREVQRLGAARASRADVRLVAATHRDLRAASARGDFREDLYYRVSVFAIRTPPLRDRPDDILPLASSFLEDFAASLGRRPALIADDARRRLLAYPWPGNVRELRNVLERAAILAIDGVITGDHLSPFAPPPPPQPVPGDAWVGAASRPAAEPPAAGPAPSGAGATDSGSGATDSGSGATDETNLAVLERAAIERALRDALYNKSRAAKRLGLTRSQLYQRLRRYGIDSRPPTV